MLSRTLRNSAVVFFTLLLSVLTPVQGEETALLSFAPGETLNFEVTWSIFPAGEVTATLSKVRDRGAEAYEIRSTARSLGFISLLFKVENEYRAYSKPDTLCSFRIAKKIHEGLRQKETEIIFDRVRKLAVLDERDLAKADTPLKHAENEIPLCVHDIVTSFYFARLQPMEVGKQFDLAVNDGAKTYVVTAEVQARERLQTPVGVRYAFRVEPKVFGGLYKRRGRMLVWFSDDDQRLPLQVKAMLAMGTLTATLRSVTTPPVIRPPTGQ
jgi:hypothetical protein